MGGVQATIRQDGASSSEDQPLRRMERERVPDFSPLESEESSSVSTPQSASGDEKKNTDHVQHLDTNSHRGEAHLFSHEIFEGTWQAKREGNAFDVGLLRKTLTNMNLNVTIYQDLKKSDLLDKIKTISSNRPSTAEILVIIILTHGYDEGRLCAYDTDGYFKTSDIWKPFENAPQWNKIPKVIIFQACRGQRTDEVFSRNPESYLTVRREKDGPLCLPKYPNGKNFLIAFSSAAGHKSVRDECRGSWYIQELCHALTSLHKPTDILTLMTRVTKQMVQKRSVVSHMSDALTFGQTPNFVSMLSQPFIVFPPVKLEENKAGPSKSLDENRTLAPTMEGDMEIKKYLCDEARYSYEAVQDSYPPLNATVRILHPSATHTWGSFEEVERMNRVCEQLWNQPNTTSLKIQYERDENLIEELNKIATECFTESTLLVIIFCKLTEFFPHGSDTLCYLCLNSNRHAPVSAIWRPFCDLEHWGGKPKIFILLDPFELVTDGIGSLPEIPLSEQDRATNADFLFVYGFGKSFTQHLCDSLSRNNSTDLLTTITSVIKSSQETSNPHPKISFLESTLRYPIYLSSKHQQESMMANQLNSCHENLGSRDLREAVRESREETTLLEMDSVGEFNLCFDDVVLLKKDDEKILKKEKVVLDTKKYNSTKKISHSQTNRFSNWKLGRIIFSRSGIKYINYNNSNDTFRKSNSKKIKDFCVNGILKLASTILD